MKFLLTAALVACFAGSSAEATSYYEQPDWVSQEATALAPSCGGLRAEVIARMDYARQIHAYYASVVPTDADLAATAGDYNWHAYWVDTYKQTIGLLKSDCH